MELGLPLNLIASAVFERSISYDKELRVKSWALFNRKTGKVCYSRTAGGS
jgi:6-phosphogluconate dehydrogenase